MRIINDGNRRLVVAHIDAFMGLMFIFFGGGIAIACGLKLFKTGHLHAGFMDWFQTIPFVLFGSLFCVIGIFLCRRLSFTFDRDRQEMTWRRTNIFGSRAKTVQLSRIQWAYVENDSLTLSQSGQVTRPYTRLVLQLDDDSLPLCGDYSSGSSEAWKRGRDAINEFLGRQPGEGTAGRPDDDIRRLVQSGQLIAAISLVRERLNCSIAEAKSIIDDMKASK